MLMMTKIIVIAALLRKKGQLCYCSKYLFTSQSLELFTIFNQATKKYHYSDIQTDNVDIFLNKFLLTTV